MSTTLESEPALKSLLLIVNRADDPDREGFIDRIAQMALEARGRFSCLYLHRHAWEPYIAGADVATPSTCGQITPFAATSHPFDDENPPGATSLPGPAALPGAAVWVKAATLGLIMTSMACLAMGLLGQLWFL